MSKPAAKVYVVIYSVYHHVHKLAVEVHKGLESTGVQAKLFQGTYTSSFILIAAKAMTASINFLEWQKI